MPYLSGVSGAIAIKAKRTRVPEQVAGQKVHISRIRKLNPLQDIPQVHNKDPSSSQLESRWSEISDGEELPNGKGAWNEADENKKSSRRRGGKNKVGDSSLAIKADKNASAQQPQSGVVNVLLYVGFGLVALGMILTFVGMGERGFKTVELKLIGPSLIGCGVLFIILRVMFCSFTCKGRNKPKPLDEKSLLSPSQETLAAEDRQSTPPLPPITKKFRKLSPIRKPTSAAVKPMTSVRHVKPRTSPERNDSPVQQTIPNFIEDEVESDADLGLDVQYVNDIKPKVASSRPITAKSERSYHESGPSTAQLTARQNIPTLDSSFNPGEVLLDPSKLETNNE